MDRPYKDLEARSKDRGEGFAWVFRLYEESLEKENSRLDLGRECILEKDIPLLLKGLEEAGIREFTFSSGWSSSNETAFEFYKAGWKVTGMTLVNTHKEWPTENYKQEPAFIFTRG
ncbi:hypothetical protein [Anaerovibrio sp.]|uniref:DUF7698 family protein n=1 Tax=Anaerovibrio sp. TaxID=1872532 RepID=UPI00388FC996